jgi:hypothetical protein
MAVIADWAVADNCATIAIIPTSQEQPHDPGAAGTVKLGMFVAGMVVACTVP